MKYLDNTNILDWIVNIIEIKCDMMNSILEKNHRIIDMCLFSIEYLVEIG